MRTLSFRSIFILFFILGCRTFGGPSAHFIFFHKTFVLDKKYLSDARYAEIMALTHLLPGPSSSQTGIAIGLLLGGYRGSIAAWLGFTLPSAILMTGFALSLSYFQINFAHPLFQFIFSIIFAIIAFAFWQMLRNYCSAAWQYLMLILSCGLLLWAPFSQIQFAVVLGAIIIGLGMACLKPVSKASNMFAHVSHSSGSDLDAHSELSFNALNSQYAWLWFVCFMIIFLGLFILAWLLPNNATQAMYQFYAGSSMVFGGGHVVLPILQQGFVSTGLIDSHSFELGYTLTQLMPGPIFSFAAYLGALLPLSTPAIFNAAIALLLMFLSSFILVFASLPYWSTLISNPKIQTVLLCLNASMVGFLLAMLIPMATKSLASFAQIVCVLLMLYCLKTKRSMLISIPLSMTVGYALHLSVITLN